MVVLAKMICNDDVDMFIKKDDDNHIDFINNNDTVKLIMTNSMKHIFAEYICHTLLVIWQEMILNSRSLIAIFAYYVLNAIATHGNCPNLAHIATFQAISGSLKKVILS